jgi:hypothetical protein
MVRVRFEKFWVQGLRYWMRRVSCNFGSKIWKYRVESEEERRVRAGGFLES